MGISPYFVLISVSPSFANTVEAMSVPTPSARIGAGM